MKIVVNKSYGGFGYGVSIACDEIIRKVGGLRTSEELISFVEENPTKCGDLRVIEIPDNHTDVDIDEYDGLETVIYVVDGKIHRA